MLLDAVMKKVAPDKKPCQVFDLIGGTSTGGYASLALCFELINL
jgi:patatin-like phospholipase/acyl hydrolase